MYLFHMFKFHFSFFFSLFLNRFNDVPGVNFKYPVSSFYITESGTQVHMIFFKVWYSNQLPFFPIFLYRQKKYRSFSTLPYKMRLHSLTLFPVTIIFQSQICQKDIWRERWIYDQMLLNKFFIDIFHIYIDKLRSSNLTTGVHT